MDVSDLDDRFLASFVLGNLDYDAQLLAIKRLLRRHKEADEQLVKEIEDIKAFAERASGAANERAVDDLVDHFHYSVFQDAAHSMAAVGMLAPFVESLFRQSFFGIRELFALDGASFEDHLRSSMPPRQQWDCRYATSGKNLVEGIKQLSEATGLADDLPADLSRTLGALFRYRNKMFHLGFEWPQVERTRFERAIVAEGWPQEWFTKATSGGEPWIFYVSEVFINHCLQIIDDVLLGLGAFVRRRA